MKWFRTHELFLGVFLTVAVFALGFGVASSVFPPNTKPETAAQEHSKQEASKASTDERIADYTWWLAVLTGGLVFVALGQGVFIARSDKTARIAANAADLSARAAVAIELPIMIVDPDNGSFGDRIEFGRRTEEFCIMRIGYKNEGRTKAFPVEVAFGWTIGNELPANPVYRETRPFAIDSSIGPDILQVDTVNLWVDLPDGSHDQIRGGTTTFWFYCRLAYLDFMQTRHEAGFCWRRFESIGGGRFLRDETPAYNRKT